MNRRSPVAIALVIVLLIAVLVFRVATSPGRGHQSVLSIVIAVAVFALMMGFRVWIRRRYRGQRRDSP